ncbi:hypothetical protein CAEBREN_17101 [Caenorhabditis brenneri]|uniref:Galectin n=1 Tax=Caenorhabditis brenneri TaxID=135651 RepID=G0NB98_CAEBE|nr:hypothetical protein CAEBREN_17101 [Caenorhabditis brenneri]
MTGIDRNTDALWIQLSITGDFKVVLESDENTTPLSITMEDEKIFMSSRLLGEWDNSGRRIFPAALPAYLVEIEIQFLDFQFLITIGDWKETWQYRTSPEHITSMTVSGYAHVHKSEQTFLEEEEVFEMDDKGLPEDDSSSMDEADEQEDEDS